LSFELDQDKAYGEFRSFIQILMLGRMIIGEPFAKFVDSTCYSESEHCAGVVTVSFSKYLPWQAMQFLQRSTHFSKTYCKPLIISKFLASDLPFHGWKIPGSGLYGGCSNGFHRSTFSRRTQNSIQISLHAIFGLFQPWKRAPNKKFRSDQRSAARFREVNGPL
jgi:hypothetical protein